MYNLWSYRRQLIGIGELENLTGYQVEATDGTIGSIDMRSPTVGPCSNVVIGRLLPGTARRRERRTRR